MRRTGLIAAVLAIALAQLPVASAAALPPPADTFHGLTPARLLDTRSGAPTADGAQSGEGALAAGQSMVLAVAGRAGVPVHDVGAVALNVTAVNPTAASFVTVWPTGVARPLASNLNLAPGRTLPNLVMVPVGPDGSVQLYNDKGSTHLAADVLGWFPKGTSFGGVTPARLLDTRDAPTVDGLQSGEGAVGPGDSLSLQVAGRGGVPAIGARSVALNVTAINPSAASFVTVWPSGKDRPFASNLNLAPGRTLPNMVVVPLGADGKVELYNDKGSTHLAVDVLGWFATTTNFSGLTPARLADTRSGAPTTDDLGSGSGALEAGGVFTVDVSGRGGVPPNGAGAVALNVTAVNPSAPSFLTVWPTDSNRPLASNLNLAPGRTLPNMVVVPLGPDGKVQVYNDKGSTHVAVDVLGWFPATVVAPSTKRVSVASAGTQGNQSVEGLDISADGLTVAFGSDSTNLVTGDGNGRFDVFVHSVLSGVTTRVSVTSGGGEVNGHSSSPALSANGRHVAFQSQATNLVVGDGNGLTDVFVHDRFSVTTERVRRLCR